MVEAQGQFTSSDVQQGVLVLSRWYLLTFGLVGLAICGLGALAGFGAEGGLTEQLPSILAGIFVAVFPWLLVMYRGYRTFKTSPVMRGPVRYTFDDFGISIQAESARSDLKWPAILKWKEGKHAFVIYLNSRVGNIVPKRFFSSTAGVDLVRQMLRTNIGRK